MIDLSIKVEMPRRYVKHADALRSMSIAEPTQAVVASAIKRRVADEGKPTTRPPPYAGVRFDRRDATRDRPYLVASRYPVQSERQGETGVNIFDSSADFHAAAGAKPGTYVVQRQGMWSGLTVMVRNLREATIQFRGRSQGQAPQSGKGGFSARGLRVSNALKAWTVLDKHGVNVLANTAAELAAVCAAVNSTLARSIARATGATATSGQNQPDGDRWIYTTLARLLALRSAP